MRPSRRLSALALLDRQRRRDGAGPPASAERGKAKFEHSCAPCHADGIGDDGRAMLPGTDALRIKYQGSLPALIEKRTDLNADAIRTFVRRGTWSMPPFRPTEITEARHPGHRRLLAAVVRSARAALESSVMNRSIASLLGCAAAGAFVAFDGGAAEHRDRFAGGDDHDAASRLDRRRDCRTRRSSERYRALEPVDRRDARFAVHRRVRAAPPVGARSRRRDRQRFVAAFQRLSVMTYAARFGTSAPTRFGRSRPAAADASGRVQVATAIKREGQPDVSLEYLLQQDEQGWRIINIVADGVSDLALKRAEYQRVFASGGIDGLIAELEQQTQRLERG